MKTTQSRFLKSKLLTGLLAMSLPSMAHLEPPQKEAWYTIDTEFSGSITLGQVREFQLEQMATDEGLQLMKQGGNVHPKTATSVYLTEEGLADEAFQSGKPPEFRGAERTTSVFIQGKNIKNRLEIRLNYEVIDLAGKPIETKNILFEAEKRMAGRKESRLFSKGTQCLFLKNKVFSRAAFFFSRQQSSPFKTLDDFDKNRKNDSGKKILKIERGQWAGIRWSNVQAVGYKEKTYYTPAVELNGKIHLASFFEAGENVVPLAGCEAYNQQAIQDIQRAY